MESEEFRLKWSNFSSNITRNIDKLWKSDNYVDVTIYSEGKSIQAHKIILSTSSTMFKEIFDVNPCQHPVIILQDVNYRELHALITFIYQGEVSIEQKNLPELLKAAKTLKISGLSDCLEKVLTDLEKPSKKRKTDPESNYDNLSFQSSSNVLLKEEPEVSNVENPDDGNTLAENCSEIVIKTENDIEIDENTINISTMEENDDKVLAWLEPTPDGHKSHLCPFCSRSYMNWGFRRRHIKQNHSKVDELTCRWCCNEFFTLETWIRHVMTEHNLSKSEAEQAIKILNEAIRVLEEKTHGTQDLNYLIVIQEQNKQSW